MFSELGVLVFWCSGYCHQGGIIFESVEKRASMDLMLSCVPQHAKLSFIPCLIGTWLAYAIGYAIPVRYI